MWYEVLQSDLIPINYMKRGERQGCNIEGIIILCSKPVRMSVLSDLRKQEPSTAT
jgi:hypothetical protein